MMRVHLTTTVPKAEAIFAEGFTDCYEEFGMRGVYVATVPLDVNDGFEGDVTLCLDVPNDLFGRYDVTDTLQEASGYRLALIPAEELNRLGKPQVYDHLFAGCSRRDLLRSIDRWQTGADQEEEIAEAEAWKGDDRPAEMKKSASGARRHAQEMRAAFDFFDRIGWLTPLKLQEEAKQGGDKEQP